MDLRALKTMKTGMPYLKQGGVYRQRSGVLTSQFSIVIMKGKRCDLGNT